METHLLRAWPSPHFRIIQITKVKNSDEGGSEEGYQVFHVDFPHVETPFIIALWILVSSLAKVGKKILRITWSTQKCFLSKINFLGPCMYMLRLCFKCISKIFAVYNSSAYLLRFFVDASFISYLGHVILLQFNFLLLFWKSILFCKVPFQKCHQIQSELLYVNQVSLNFLKNVSE